MPTELQIIRAREFVRLGAYGKLNLEASLTTLVKLAQVCRTRSITRALLDVRDVRTELTPEELAKLVAAFHDIGFPPDQRLALLHIGDAEYRARTFALIGRLSGWKVQDFDDFEQAVSWLSELDDQEPHEDSQGSTTDVPISQKSSDPPRPIEADFHSQEKES